MAPRAQSKFSTRYYFTIKFLIYTISALTICSLFSDAMGIAFISVSILDEVVLGKYRPEK